MHFLIRTLLLTLIIFLSKAPLFSLLDDTNDKQFWCYQCVNIPLKKHIIFTLEGEERWGDDISKLFLYHMQYLLKYQISDVFSFGAGYRKIWSRTADFVTSFSSDTVLFDIIFTKKFNDFTLTNRNRTEYVILEETNLWLYRCRFELIYNKPCLKPYVSNELFFLEKRGFAQNRLIVGVRVPISEKNCLKIEYLDRLVDIKHTWRRHPIFGISLIITL